MAVRMAVRMAETCGAPSFRLARARLSVRSPNVPSALPLIVRAVAKCYGQSEEHVARVRLYQQPCATTVQELLQAQWPLPNIVNHCGLHSDICSGFAT